MTMTYFVLPTISVESPDNFKRNKVANYLPSYYDKMVEEGLLEYAFYDGGVKSFDDFANIALNPNIVFLLAFKKYEDSLIRDPIGHLYIANMQGYCGMAHFNLLRAYHKKAVDVMTDVLNEVFSVKRKDGTPFVTTLLGLTPMTNFPAIRTIKKVGFETIAIIDKICYLHYKDKYVDGNLSRRVKNGISR